MSKQSISMHRPGAVRHERTLAQDSEELDDVRKAQERAKPVPASRRKPGNKALNVPSRQAAVGTAPYRVLPRCATAQTMNVAVGKVLGVLVAKPDR